MIPPSPLLSARSVIMTYFKVVCKVSVQKIQEMVPNTNVSLTTEAPFNIALIVYSGEVPKSPKTIPSVINKPATDTFDADPADEEEECFILQQTYVPNLAIFNPKPYHIKVRKCILLFQNLELFSNYFYYLTFSHSCLKNINNCYTST